jgi:hypothetical protein
MLGIGKGVTLALVGWLWADLLLGLFAIFLAANSAGTPAQAKQQGIDPKVVAISVSVNGPNLLSSDARVVETEQRLIAAQVEQQMTKDAPGRKVALVLAFGSHDRPELGDKIAKIGTDPLRNTLFSGAVVNTYHALVQNDTGSSIAMEVYVYY